MTLQPARIICAIDFSSLTPQAVNYAAKMAQTLGAELFLFHAVFYAKDPIRDGDISGRANQWRVEASKKIETLKELMSGVHVKWQPVFTEGEPVAELEKAVRRHRINLALAASHEFSALKRMFIGTVVERMARRLTIPLMIMRLPEQPTTIEVSDTHFKRILVACNATQNDQALLDVALFFARRFQAELHLCHAAESPLAEEIIDPTEGPYEEVQTTLQKRLKEQLMQNLTHVSDLPAAPKTVVIPSPPHEALRDYAREFHPDLIIVGVKPEGVIKKHLIGSTTESVLRHAKTTTVIVPLPKTASLHHEKKPSMGTGIVMDKRFLSHCPAEGHPENHRRLEVIYQGLANLKTESPLVYVKPRQATSKEITWIHHPRYERNIAATSGQPEVHLTPDTHTSAGSYTAALLAAGGMFEALTQIKAGTIQNALVLARPPGHHAEQSRAMGYCLFNTVALGAKFAQNELGLKRVLIVDWDVHHGNGTQHAFETDSSVLFFSLHQFPMFPGTGIFTETGHGKGEGYTINIPLPKGYGDGEYLALFESILKPITMTFKPDVILVSAGFDTHRSDPIGGMQMTADGFAGMTRILMDLADRCCAGRMALCLEGGYHLKALQKSIERVILELTGTTRSVIDEMIARADPAKVDYAIKRCTHVHQNYWSCLKSVADN